MPDHVDNLDRTVLEKGYLGGHVIVERRKPNLPPWEERTKKVDTALKCQPPPPPPVTKGICLECGKPLPPDAHGSCRRHRGKCVQEYRRRQGREYMRSRNRLRRSKV